MEALTADTLPGSPIQIEGAYKADGKSMSVWDVFTHQGGNVRDGTTGDVACDHYHRYPQDYALMKSMGINMHRWDTAQLAPAADALRRA
jgi:beta-glucosidase